jgi:hypothetical protein
MSLNETCFYSKIQKHWISKVFFVWISNPSLLGFQILLCLDFSILLWISKVFFEWIFKSLHYMDFKILLCLHFSILFWISKEFFAWISKVFFEWISKSFFAWISNPSLLGF